MTLESSGVSTMNSTGDDTFKEYEQMTLESSGVITMNSTGDDTFTEYEQMTLKSSGVNTMNSTGDKNAAADVAADFFGGKTKGLRKSSDLITMNHTES